MLDVLKALARLINSATRDEEGYWVLQIRLNVVDMNGDPVMNFNEPTA